jgi:hypothetical protein
MINQNAIEQKEKTNTKTTKLNSGYGKQLEPESYKCSRSISENYSTTQFHKTQPQHNQQRFFTAFLKVKSRKYHQDQSR